MQYPAIRGTVYREIVPDLFFLCLKESGRTELVRGTKPGQTREHIFRWRYIMRTRITLACTECKHRNYDTTKDKKNHPERMEIKKYCPFCRRHTLHKETK